MVEKHIIQKNKDYIDRFNALGKKTNSASLRHEIEKYINSKKTDEYLKEQGV